MFKHLFKFSVLVAVISLLAACTITFMPPHPLNDLAANYLLAIAVDSQGTKHIVGEDPTTHQLVYLRTRLGIIEDKQPIRLITGWWPAAPEIGVLADGTVILAWYEKYDASSPKYRICIKIYPSSVDVVCTPDFSDNPPDSFSPIVKVITRGSTGYVIYSKQEGTQYTLRYEKVSSGSERGKVNSESSDPMVRTVEGVVDSAGYLHVIWYARGAPGTGRVLYASNRTTDGSGNMTQNRILLIADSDLLNPPAITTYSTAGSERVAFAYVKDNSGSDDEIYHQNIKVDNTDWSGEMKLTLSGGAYRLGDVHLVGVNNAYLIGFLRNNTISATSEVWLRDAAGMITQITNNTYSERELEMVPAGGGFVMAYKRQPQSSEPRQVFIYDPIKGERLIYSESCSSDNSGGEMAASGEVVAGVWAQCDRVWFSANAELVYLPLVRK
ncbi:hypothetical protein BECAL_03324 [Bellilinea caldifistulae]|uniref:Uncharacterized protein n=1 Tax=Bellilinea caldifistulae TaxID=360411 RepID=A0A0P6X7W8_9CHLR|nr:hypothetical protein [Bellilinea caldifistulae]KPL76420.1 hypothetical protein AC812_07175 [Bellilinea caldifistulae]GAP12122.1 hypothetical protein BECAL_03324 [Bellilinea caldifistulae]